MKLTVYILSYVFIEAMKMEYEITISNVRVKIRTRLIVSVLGCVEAISQENLDGTKIVN